MKINIRIFLFFILLINCNYILSCNDKSFSNVKIGILLNSSYIEVESLDGVYVIDSLNKKVKFNNIININLKCIDKFINIDKYKFLMPIKIEPIKDNIISVNKNRYRGYIELKKSLTNKINIINVLKIDEYIMGVLPKEMSKYNEKEALKAQAIVSRTYTIVNYNKHIFDGFNLCSGVHCQVYGGYDFESNSTNEAVIETKNEVLTYNNKFAETFYHANCGGYTEKPKHVWGYNNKSLKYLNGVKCGYCNGDFHSKWETILDIKFIEKKFLLNNINIGKIKNIKIKKKTKLGTTKLLEIDHSKGKTVLTSYKFRIIVDSNKIKSHNFIIKKKKKKFLLIGSGWGHKVGMCQCGANNMAKKQNYKNILDYYYPGTKIIHIGDI
jgi:stage II sporulation protein D